MLKRTILTLALASSPALAAPPAPPEPPAGISWRNQAVAQPIVIDRGDGGSRFQRFVIRRERHDEDADDRRNQDLSAHGDGDDSLHDYMGGYDGDTGPYQDEWIDEGREDLAYDDGADHYVGRPEHYNHHRPSGPAYGYAQGPCCSGGMITETITTTTTYPPAVHERVSYGHVAEHKPVRIGKRKMRRR